MLPSLREAPDLHTAARAYCEAGWSVIPARVAAKRALVRWREWQHSAPDLEQLRAWWARWPRANLAVITGRRSGVVVVDVDLRHGGDQVLAELEAKHGDLPWQAVVETPSGGWHVYLRHPGGRVVTSASRVGTGVDIRGDGGLALLPPSSRAAGVYRWAVGGPDTVPELPRAWVELVRAAPIRRPSAPARPGREGRHEARLAGLLRVVGEAPEGRRNATLHWAACRLREMLDQGAPREWAQVLEQAGVAAGLDQVEVRDTVASGLGRAER
jgi:hypothetical protein